MVRWFLATFFALTLASPAAANHFSEEFEYLNGTALSKAFPCIEPTARERLRCEMRDDANAGIRYIIYLGAEQQVVRVWRVIGNGEWELIYGGLPERTVR